MAAFAGMECLQQVSMLLTFLLAKKDIVLLRQAEDVM